MTFPQEPNGCLLVFDYSSGRKLNKALIKRLSDCEYISDCRNIFITGATGSGKSYLACALGMEACKHYYNTKLGLRHKLPDILSSGEFKNS